MSAALPPPRGRNPEALRGEEKRPQRRLRSETIMLPILVSLLLLSCSARRNGNVRIEFWGLGREGEVVAELIPEFERLNPGIEVDVQQLPWTAAHEKLLTAYVGESAPDLAQMGNTWVPEFEAIGALAPLDSWISSSATIAPEHYFRGIWLTNVVDGQVYGVPWYVDTRLLFYRTDVLRAAGWKEFPRTWDEWLRLMDVIREKNLAKWPIFLATNEWPPPVILGLQTGSTILNPEGTRGDFLSPQWKRAFHFYMDFFRKGYAPPLSYNQIANIYQQFAEKDFAMLITGPWNVGEFRRRLPPEVQDEWSTAPMPAPPGDPYPGLSTAGGSSLVMFAASREKEASWKLIQFLSRPDVQIRFFELSGNLPARKEAWEAQVFRSDREMRAFRVQLENVAPTPKVPEWEQIATAVFEHAESAIRGGMSVEQALVSLQKKADSILEKRRWMLRQARVVSQESGR